MLKNIINEIKIIIQDTLKHNNKYNERKFIISQSFILIALAFIYDTLINQKVNIELFLVFAVLAGYASTLNTVASGMKNKLEQEEKTIENAEK